MSWNTPLEWRQVVVDHYGSVGAFTDRSTVNIMRGKIVAARSDLRILMDAGRKFPGIFSQEDMTRMAGEDQALLELDDELEEWLALASGQMSEGVAA